MNVINLLVHILLSILLNIIINNYKDAIKFSKFDKTIFEYFINEVGEVRDINSIFSNSNVINLDHRILLAFIKTDKIKQAIQNTKLNEYTSIIINRLLNNKSEYLENFKDINNKSFG